MGNRNTRIPIVDGTTGLVQQHEDGPVVCRVGPKTGWVDWLERTPSFHYKSPDAGNITCSRETRERGQGAGYWYARRTINNRLRKKYLGRSHDLCLGRLNEAAGALANLQLEDALAGEAGG